MEKHVQHGTGGEPAIIMVSKHTTVKELKKMVKDKVGVELEDQLLFAARRKMEEGRTMDESGVEAKSRVMLVSKKAGEEDQKKRARADEDPPLHMQGDHRGGPPMEGREEEDRVEEAASLQRDSQVEEEIKVRDEEGGRMSPRDKNKEGLKDPPSREAMEKEVHVGGVRDPKRAETGQKSGQGEPRNKNRARPEWRERTLQGQARLLPSSNPSPKEGRKEKTQRG